MVDGIECQQPAVANLPTSFWDIRDQNVAPGLYPGQNPPSWDLTLNYVPIAFPKNIPAAIDVSPDRDEFWRVANTSADTIVDLQLIYDGQIQPVKIVALDGVVTGSQDGTKIGRIVKNNHVYLPPASRAEFIVRTPSAQVKRAVWYSAAIDGGPAGDNNTGRTLAVLHVNGGAGGPPKPADDVVGKAAQPVACSLIHGSRFAGIDAVPTTVQRKIYFSEVARPGGPGGSLRPHQTDNDALTDFFVTVDGQQPILFDPNNPPAIVTRQGSVEEWTIENRTTEVHEFHMHQIHFEWRKVNGINVLPDDRQIRDTLQVPYWKGFGRYPQSPWRWTFAAPW